MLLVLILLIILCGAGGYFLAVTLFDLIFKTKPKSAPIHFHNYLSITHQSVTINKETTTRDKITRESKTTTTI